MSSPSEPGSQRLRRITLVVMAIGISALFLWMIHQFLNALMLAALLSALFQPVYNLLRRRLGDRKTLASAATVLLVSLLVVIPMVGFSVLIVTQVIELAGAVGGFVRDHAHRTSELKALVEDTAIYRMLDPYWDQVPARLAELAGMLGRSAAELLTRFASNAATFAFMLFVMLYAMFFFLKDGRAALSKILYYLPLGPADENRMLEKFVSVTRATLKGTLVIGLVQGTLSGLAFWVAGVDGVLVWSTLIVALAAIPGLGPPLVWIPVVVYLAVIGRWGACFGLLAWCTLVVGTIDNFLRPWLVGRDTKLPDLLVLLSTLGGIVMFGVSGVLIGPIIAALFITIWDLYGLAYQGVLPETDMPLSQGRRPPR